MPSLNDLSLNRFIKRDNRNIDPTDAGSSMFADINNNQGNANTVGGVGNSSNSTSGQTNSVVPGSIIQSVTLQSSGSDNRVEINPDDQFLAYNDGDVVVRINKDGIEADYIDVIDMDAVNITVDNLDVTTEITYKGIVQPVLFSGEILGDGTVVTLPTGWSVLRNSLGDYTFTHNLGALNNYFVFASPVSGHYRHQVVSRNTNDFNITYEQTLYGSDTFPVSGGGGGNVTVDGVRLAPGEEPWDVAFQFQVLFYG